MTWDNDLRREPGAQRPLAGAPPLPGARGDRAGHDVNGAVLGAAVDAADPARVSVDDHGTRLEAAEAEQLVEQIRSGTEGPGEELVPGSKDDLGWAGLLAELRAAATTQRAIVEAEERLLALRERAAAEVDAVYEAAAGRAEELVSEARSMAATLVRDARAESERIRRDAEASAQLVRSDADRAAATILGEADREAGTKLAAVEITLRDKIAQAEREAALILEKSREQATAWMAESKQACAEMVRRAGEEADRMLEATRAEPADVLSKLGRSKAEPEPGGSDHGLPPTDLTSQAEPVATRQRQSGIAGEPVIGSRGATTAFTTRAETANRSDETGHQDGTARGDGRAREGGRRRRLRR